jgi:hypothetical protein
MEDIMINNCIVCGQTRWMSKDEPIWITDIIIIPWWSNDSTHQARMTVCPECRRLPFGVIATAYLNKRGDMNEISKGKKSKSCRPTSNTQSRGNNRTSRKRVGVQKVADKKPKRRSNRRVR